VWEAIKQFDNPELTPDACVGRLSVGSQQLVEIARALAIGCDVLVLDEPTSSLTQQDVERLFEIIKRLQAQGKAIVYISHFIEEVKRVADRVMVLRDGKVVGNSKAGAISTDEIVSLMVGRQVNELYPRSERKAGEVALEIENLAGPENPKSASLKLHRGEVLGIAGLVGAGRTELLRCLFGLEPVRKGRIKLGVYTGPAVQIERLRPAGTGLAKPAGQSDPAMARSPKYPLPGAPAIGSLPVGRKPAESGAGKIAPARCGCAAAGRAYARNRRGGQGTGLQAHQCPGCRLA